MKTINLFVAQIIAMAATVAMAGTVYAATPLLSQEVQRTASQAKHEGSGVLKAVNPEGNKVQIAHEAIPSLQWPAMTMWFTLRGPLPNGVEAGDSVHFELDQNRSNEWVITRIEHKR
jgi:Cu/Ag efflux protein CusF